MAARSETLRDRRHDRSEIKFVADEIGPNGKPMAALASISRNPLRDRGNTVSDAARASRDGTDIHARQRHGSFYMRSIRRAAHATR